MEEKEFTITGVFFAATGSVPILEDASDAYKERVSEEIKNDSVYSFLVSDIKEEDRFKDEKYPDYDPVVFYYISESSPLMNDILQKYLEKGLEEPLITQESYIKLSKISNEKYHEYLKLVNRRISRLVQVNPDTKDNNKILTK